MMCCCKGLNINIDKNEEILYIKRYNFFSKLDVVYGDMNIDMVEINMIKCVDWLKFIVILGDKIFGIYFI